jgi:hypothetical protein
MNRRLLLIITLILFATGIIFRSITVESSQDLLQIQQSQNQTENNSSCGTRNVSEYEAALVQDQLVRFISNQQDTLSKRLAEQVTVSIPVYFHVINKGSGIGNGDIPDSMIQAQIQVLSNTYSGVTGGATTRFTFNLVEVTRTNNEAWFTANKGSNETANMMVALRRQGANKLNIFSNEPRVQGSIVAGYATFPQDYTNNPSVDAVVIKYTTLPGGTEPNQNLGYTTTHEVGHWLGLYHTFQGGCNEKFGDYIWDTPAEANDQSATNSCRSWGFDANANFMNYFPDSQMSDFTPGQAERISLVVAQYRGL